MTDVEREVLVCSRATGPAPRVPSYVDTCVRCGATVWRSSSSIGFRGEVICLEHVLRWVADDIAALSSSTRPCPVHGFWTTYLPPKPIP